jgi:hypothetical protein
MLVKVSSGNLAIFNYFYYPQSIIWLVRGNPVYSGSHICVAHFNLCWLSFSGLIMYLLWTGNAINDHGRFSIVPGIPGATFSRISCLIPVKSVKRCMYKTILDKTFRRCRLAIPPLQGVPVNTYYSILADRSGYPTFFTID